MQARNFSLLGASALATVRAKAAAAVAAWAAQWGADATDVTLVCERADRALAGVAWDQCWNAGTRQLWLACPGAMQDAVQQALFGADAHAGRAPAAPQLAPLAAARALAALQGALAAALLGEPAATRAVASQPGAQQLGHGAGTLLVQLRLGAASCRVLLDSASVALLAPSTAPARAPLPALDYLKALHATPVRLPVRLARVELGLGALMSVAVGDVIRLHCPVEAAVDVLGPAGDPLFRGYLGQIDGTVAVDIDSRH